VDGRIGRRLGWAALAASAGMVLSGIVLYVLNLPAGGDQLLSGTVVPALLGLIYPAVGAVLVTRLPRNPIGGIGLFNALAMGVLERRREIGILVALRLRAAAGGDPAPLAVHPQPAEPAGDAGVHRRGGFAGHGRAGAVRVARADR